MTELIQPLALTGSPEHAEPPAPSFTEVVYAHYRWWHRIRDGSPSDTGAYQRLRRAFEEAHGTIVHAFWCSHVESAVVLVERPRAHRWQRRRYALHRESDWATKDFPKIAAELHRCDELAVRAESVLTGMRQRICMQLVAASASHLLSLVDRASGHADPDAVEEALTREHDVLDKTWRYYREAANGQAQIAYFLGMAVVAGVIGGVAGTLVLLHWQVALASLIAGAAGATVSVIQRINAGDFELDYDVGRPYAFFLGGLRPLIGGGLALAISFAFTSGILHLPISAKDPTANDNLALVVLSFLAGFSERWAQDTLTSALPKAPQGPEDDVHGNKEVPT